MPIVQLSDGTLVEIPETFGERASRAGTRLKQVGADLVSGFGKSAAGMFTSVLSPEAQEAGAYKTPGWAKTATEFWDKFGKEKGQEEGYSKAITQGAGGALTMPIPIGGVAKTLAVNAAPGAAGGAAQQAGNNFFPEDSRVGQAAGLLTSLLTGFALGPRQSAAQADIRRATRDIPEADWAAAERNLADFNKAGMKTATVAEAFPGKTSIGVLARDAMNSKGGEALAQQLSGRKDELADLTNRTVRAIGPRVEGGTVAGKAAKAADDIIEDLLQKRSQDYGFNIDQAPDISQFQVNGLINDLRAKAKTVGVSERKEALLNFADSLKNVNTKRPLTSVREIVDVLKLSRDKPLTRNAPTATKAEGAINSDVYNTVSDFFKAISPMQPPGKIGARANMPGYNTAERQFKGATEGVINPMTQGPIGQIAGRSFKEGVPTPESRLNVVGNIDDPAMVRQVLGQLEQTGGQGLAREIATALAQNRTFKGTTNVAEALGGKTPNSPMEQNFFAQLDAAGVDPTQIQANMNASRMLQDLQGPTGAKGFPFMRYGQLILRPFRTIDMMTTGNTIRSTQEEIAALLMRNDPAVIAELRKIAAFDPAVRALLGAKSSGQTLIQGEDQ